MTSAPEAVPSNIVLSAAGDRHSGGNSTTNVCIQGQQKLIARHRGEGKPRLNLTSESLKDLAYLRRRMMDKRELLIEDRHRARRETWQPSTYALFPDVEDSRSSGVSFSTRR